MDSVLFSKPDYISTGDQFQDCYRFKLRETSPENYSITHDKIFKPSGSFKVGNVAYQHMEEGFKDKVIHKDKEGKVPLGPKNFLTNPPKQGLASATVQ